MQHVDTRGVNFVASFEGFSSRPYWDPYGRVWTIGFGETEGVGPHTPPITRTQGLVRLRRKLDGGYADAVRALGVPLNQGQFDALVSFVYNLGTGIIARHTTMGNLLRSREYQAAANAMLAYDHAGGQRLPGLTRRRNAERSLFLSGGGGIAGKLHAWRVELAKRRAQLRTVKNPGTRHFLIRRINELKALIRRNR